MVVDQAGYILTNNHVVDKADRIQVKFTGDPTEYDAKVVGVDAPTDLAVIRVEGKHESDRRPRSAIPTPCRWAIGPWPSARRSASRPP